jgi:hypothetical protein
MESFHTALLVLFEDVLCGCLEALKSPFGIYEIPETERDPLNPIRLEVGLRESLTADPDQPAEDLNSSKG